MKVILAIILFVGAYLCIATEKVNKTVAALIAAILAIGLGVMSFHQAIAAVDFNVIFLLLGMMISVHILSKSGFFEYVAITVAKKAKGSPIKILIFLLGITAIFSAFLDNVTTIILIAPVTILITQLLEIPSVPFLILEVIASNIGGAATLIGDPPNIVIGSSAGLSFMDFISNLGSVILIVVVLFLLTVWGIYRKKFVVEKSHRERVTKALPHLAIVDKKTMKKSLIIFAFIFVGFFFHGALNLEPGLIALFGSMIMLLACHKDGDELMSQAEWGVIMFFVGMFMLVAALEVNGIIEYLGQTLISRVGLHPLLMCMVVLWGAALFSAVLDNIPFVIAMIPLIKDVNASFSVIDGFSPEPIWWALALGACLGGNGTLIGASANVVMVRIAKKNNCHIGFLEFSRYGIGYTFQALIICSIYLWLRYFVL